MSGEIEFEGQTEREALGKAAAEFAVAESQLDYKVIDPGSVGLFGLGARPARISAKVKLAEEPAPVAVAPIAAPAPEEAAVERPARRRRDDESGEGRRPRREGPPRSERREEAPRREARAEVDDDGERLPSRTGPAPEKAAKALEVTTALVEKMGVAATVTVRDEDAEIVVTIAELEGRTEVAEILGSGRPPALPSLQFLLNKIVNRFPEDRKHIVIDAPTVSERLAERRAVQPPRAEAPRPKREFVAPEGVDPELVALAQLLATKAIELNKVLTIHPMSAPDRKAIHQTVMAIDGAETVSEGEGIYRRLHIVPSALGSRPSQRRRRRRRRRGGRGGAEGGAADAPTDA